MFVDIGAKSEARIERAQLTDKVADLYKQAAKAA